VLDKQGRGANNAGGDDDDDDDDATYSMATNTNADNDMTYDNVQKPAQMEDYEAPGFDTVESSDNAVVVDSTYGQTERTEEETREVVTKTMDKWFQPMLSRDDARKTLAGAPFGAFVVRNSSRGGSFAISVKAKERKIWNGLIEPCDGGYTFNNRSRVFATVTDVIVYCMTDGRAKKMGLPGALATPEDVYDC